MYRACWVISIYWSKFSGRFLCNKSPFDTPFSPAYGGRHHNASSIDTVSFRCSSPFLWKNYAHSTVLSGNANFAGALGLRRKSIRSVYWHSFVRHFAHHFEECLEGAVYGVGLVWFRVVQTKTAITVQFIGLCQQSIGGCRRTSNHRPFWERLSWG